MSRRWTGHGERQTQKPQPRPPPSGAIQQQTRRTDGQVTDHLCACVLQDKSGTMVVRAKESSSRLNELVVSGMNDRTRAVERKVRCSTSCRHRVDMKSARNNSSLVSVGAVV